MKFPEPSRLISLYICNVAFLFNFIPSLYIFVYYCRDIFFLNQVIGKFLDFVEVIEYFKSNNFLSFAVKLSDANMFRFFLKWSLLRVIDIAANSVSYIFIKMIYIQHLYSRFDILYSTYFHFTEFQKQFA